MTARVDFKVQLDNRVRSGQQTIDELIANLQKSFQGQDVFPLVKDVIADPLSGQATGLLVVLITLADVVGLGAIAETVNAINAIEGVLELTGAIPQPLFTSDLNASDGLVLSTTALTSNQEILCLATDESIDAFLGILNSPNVYTDGIANTLGLPKTFLQITVQLFPAAPTETLTIPPGDLTLNRIVPSVGVVPTVVANAFPIVIKAETGKLSRDEYFLDIDGRAYLSRRIVDGMEVISRRSYAGAVLFGSV